MAGEIRVVQSNMHRSQVASNLLRQIQAEHEADLLLMSEQYENPDTQTWIPHDTRTVAIWIANPAAVSVERKGIGNGFVWIRSRGVTYFSCYFTPNESIGAFRTKLGALEDVIRDCTGYVVLGGDLNAKAADWGENMDSRVTAVVEMAARVGLIVLNRGTVTTFRTPGYRETIIEITLASEKAARRIDGWRVLEDFTASDHQYIFFSVQIQSRTRNQHSAAKETRFNTVKLNKDVFDLMICSGYSEMRRLGLEHWTAEEIPSARMPVILRACEASMPRKKTSGKRRAAYWWTEEIAELRRTVTQNRNATAEPSVAQDAQTMISIVDELLMRSLRSQKPN